LNPTLTRFVGLSNYSRLADDPYFWSSLTISLILTGATLIIENTLGLLLAVLVSQALRGRRLYNTLIFAPVVIPPIYVGILWSWFAHKDLGLISPLFQFFSGEKIALLGEPFTALLTIIVANNWKWIGFAFAIYLASLQEIPSNLYEAAQLDGANRFRIFFHIILPMLKKTIIMLSVLITAGAFQTFDLVYSMTEGGPARSTEVLPLYIYRVAFFYYDVGLASAMAVIMFLITLSVSFIYLRILRGE
jgi:ABC-type sugar transport system permease subunit